MNYLDTINEEIKEYLWRKKELIIISTLVLTLLKNRYIITYKEKMPKKDPVPNEQKKGRNVKWKQNNSKPNQKDC